MNKIEPGSFESFLPELGNPGDLPQRTWQLVHILEIASFFNWSSGVEVERLAGFLESRHLARISHQLSFAAHETDVCRSKAQDLESRNTGPAHQRLKLLQGIGRPD